MHLFEHFVKNANDVIPQLRGYSLDKKIQLIRSCPSKIFSDIFERSQKINQVNDLIPSHVDPLKEIIFYGKNSLPLFSSFEKRICLSPDKLSLWGYNEQKLKVITGPGYFIIDQNSDRPDELMFDYTRIPYDKVKHWPKIRSNTTGLNHLVYGGMKDYLRKIADSLYIGEATKKGASMNQYFLLCRETL